MTFSRTLKSVFAVSALTLSTLTLSSVAFAVNIDMSADANDVAIGGYDTVSYFTDSQPVLGSSKYSATYIPKPLQDAGSG